ncbi:MAG: DUF4176 domain-containing protein [Lachnospiraceae bacterium]|nr:DUF4176 domain-containing protein [Lachnospiraceae bacterium]
MYKDLLPIGSVVLLKEAKTRLMITGRIIASEKNDQIYDYSGCIYPLGITDNEGFYFFNRDDIERVYFIGFQDEEELAFREDILSQLGELKIKDGQIVSAEED